MLANKSLIRDKQWREARKELEELTKRGSLQPRELTFVEEGEDECVICGVDTHYILQPENAPLCSTECKHRYLHNPSVYDPLGLYGTPRT